MKIAIVGAGLIGRMCAWQLLQADKMQTANISSIEIFDRDSIGGTQSTAWVAAAMLAPVSESMHAPADIFEFGQRALSMWPQLIANVEKQSRSDIFFQNNGSYVIAHPQDQNLLNEFKQHLEHSTFINNNDYQPLNKQSLHAQVKQLRENFSQGIYLPQEACLDNRQLLLSLASILKSSQKVSWHEQCTIDDIENHTIYYSGKHSTFDLVIDCRGSGAIDSDKNLRGVRGEIIWVKAPNVNIQHAIRLMHPRYQLYIAPHADNTFVIGATQIESDDNKAITVRSSLELLSALYAVSSEFAEAEILGSYARLRPAYKDNLPRIDYNETQITVNGLYRHGYLLAPVISHDVAQLVTQKNNLLWPDIVHRATMQASNIKTANQSAS